MRIDSLLVLLYVTCIAISICQNPNNSSARIRGYLFHLTEIDHEGSMATDYQKDEEFATAHHFFAFSSHFFARLSQNYAEYPRYLEG